MLDERWDDDQAQLAAGLRSLLAAECTPDVVRAAEASEEGRACGLEEKLDAFGLWSLPAEPGLLTAAAWELGRALAPVPFPETAAVSAVVDADGAASALDSAFVPAVAGGALVLDGDRLVRVDLGPARRTAAGEWVARPSVGAGEGDVIGTARQADRIRRMSRLLAAARLVGAAEGVLSLAVGYAKGREQFGQPIAAFQAVAHRLADMATAVDGAGLLVRKAAWVATDGDGAPSWEFARMAAWKAADTARVAATGAHQVMGGYGFAMEEDCQLFSRRIRSWSARMGRPDIELADLARTLLAPRARDRVRWLWHHEQGLALPRWAAELEMRNNPPTQIDDI